MAVETLQNMHFKNSFNSFNLKTKIIPHTFTLTKL